jgi:hypothetical protein
MAPAVATKFCKKSKNLQIPTKHSKDELCGDCGAPPFTGDDDSEPDEAAPTSEYLAGAEGAPHYPTLIQAGTPVSSINLVPGIHTHTLPLTLKANPHVGAHRIPNKRKLKKNSAAAAKDSEILQTQLYNQAIAQGVARELEV